MPTIRETSGTYAQGWYGEGRKQPFRIVINEWQLSEVAGAFDVPCHAKNKGIEAANLSLASRNKSMKGEETWYGGLRSVEAARKLMENGWSDGVERLQSLCSDLNPPQAKTRKRRPEWRDDGDELSVDRAMSGAWDQAWRTSRRVWSAGPTTIDLYTIYGGSAGMTAEQIFWNGAACVVLADRLESAGYRVRIVASFLHGNGDTVVRSDVVIKEADEPLRIDGVAAILCHAGVYRTFLFRTWGVMPFALTDGLGPAIYQFNSYAVAKMKAAGEWPEGSIVIDQALNRDQCIARIDEIMGKIENT